MIFHNLLRLIALLLLGVPSAALHAADPQDEPKPRQPIVGHVPDVSLCLVTFKYKDANSTLAKGGAPAATPPPRPVTTQTEKRGSICRQITTMSNGAKRENWSINGEQICKNLYSEAYLPVSAGNPLYIDFTTSDFGELAWVGIDNYVGVSKVEPKAFIFAVKNIDRRPTDVEKEEYSTQMAVYQTTVDSKATGPQRTALAKKELDQYMQQKFGGTESRVTLDVTNQLPVEYDDGTVVRTYSYSDKVDQLSAPVSVMRAIQYWAALSKSAKVRPSPP